MGCFSLTASELTDTQGVNVQVINIESGTLDILIKDASNNGIVSKSKTLHDHILVVM